MSRSITIVYDNRLYDQNLKSGWGFSCLIRYGDKKVLFDTGDDPDKLSFNLKTLAINVLDITDLIMSHDHWDHTGGIDAIINKNSKLILYFGSAFSESFKQKLRHKEIKFRTVDEMVGIDQKIFVGPQMDGFGPKEIPLTVETNKGLVIITGCAHPGISKMVKEVKGALKKNVYLIVGGFHLAASPRLNSIISELKELGVQKVAPCHCTGENAINLFEKEFKENFIAGGAGLKVEI